MQVAAYQMVPQSGDVAANLAKIEQAAASAAAMGAALLVTPELSLTGYAAWKQFEALAEPVDGAMVSALAAIADRHGIAITAGFPEREGAVIYNAVVTVQPGGQRDLYRKVHLYGPKEQAVFTASTRAPAVFALGGLRAAMLVCYDVEFPEMVRGVALSGVDLVIVPTALPAGPSARQCSEILVPARAAENQVFIIYADLCGTEGRHPYEGRSVIAAPDGEALARAGASEALLVTALDAARYEAIRRENPYLDDRKAEVYRQFP